MTTALAVGVPLLRAGSDVRPSELRAALLADDETRAFADQVDGLEIVARCPCRTEGCATFDTVARPEGPLPGYQTYVLESFGLVGVSDGKIAIVDMIDDVELSRRLRELDIGYASN